jgi:hypothetical protein
MKREFEHINYLESERLARLENRAAKLERTLSGASPRQTAAGNQASERGTVRRGRVQRAAGRDSGYRGAAQRDARDDEGVPGGPEYKSGGQASRRGAVTVNAAPQARGRHIGQESGRRWPERDHGGVRAQRRATGDSGREAGDLGADPRYYEAEGGYSGPGTAYREATANLRAMESGYRDWPEGHDDPDEGYDGPDDDYDEPEEGYDEPDNGYDEDDDGYDGYDGYDGDGYHVLGAGHPVAGSGYQAADGGHRAAGSAYRDTAGYHVAGPPGYGAGFAGAQVHGYGATVGAKGSDERTEVLLKRGRRHARPTGLRRWTRHWRAIGICAAAVLGGVIALVVIVSSASPSWPASVAVVQQEITVACQNPNVVSEPTQVNFACAKDTSSILWVFSLLTSGDNPNFSDRANGRQGLEPITPAQGGDVAWSLNLHHPYEPTNATDSLEVAARAINDIIGGATLTGSNGAPVVQPGLESSAANCARYTGSSALVTHQGFPAICALPVNTPAGQAALVSDVFKQWMLGTSAQTAADAGVLFENADNPGAPQVQAILNSLPQSRL